MNRSPLARPNPLAGATSSLLADEWKSSSATAGWTAKLLRNESAKTGGTGQELLSGDPGGQTANIGLVTDRTWPVCGSWKKSGQPKNCGPPPTLTANRSSRSLSIGREPRTSAPLLVTNSRDGLVGPNAMPNGLRKPRPSNR